MQRFPHVFLSVTEQVHAHHCLHVEFFLVQLRVVSSHLLQVLSRTEPCRSRFSILFMRILLHQRNHSVAQVKDSRDFHYVFCKDVFACRETVSTKTRRRQRQSERAWGTR